MHHKLEGFHSHIFNWHYLWSEAILVLVLAVLIFTSPASAAMRFQERSLYMNSTLPGATTSYEVGFRYMSPLPVGSVDMLFCVDPIPYHACVTPAGLDVSNAVLSAQSGETGFSILSKTTNHIVLTRTATTITDATSAYVFDGIKNPTNTTESFSIRLKSHASTNATGAQIDFGSVKGQVSEGLIIETQVPPHLTFCVAKEVAEDCTETDGTYFSDMGTLDENSTLVAQSEMAIGTNATAGFVITANGPPMSAGTNIINSIATPTESRPGTNQFGINLVSNTAPAIGNDPQGPWTNAITTPDYGMTDMYKFVSGDVVAQAPNVSLMRKYTVSYIVNASQSLRAGVYTTTITYIASGRF